MPNWPAIISAVTRQNHAVPIPIDNPVKILGEAAGSITSVKRARLLLPKLLADAINLGSTPITPCMVFSKIGNRAPVKVMNIIETSEEGNIRIAKGIQATAG